MLSPPPGKENGGSVHCSPHGLVAYGSGSSVVVIEPRSMQLVAVLPMPALKNASLQPAPFVTAVQWTPEPIPRDLAAQDFSTAHLHLAVGDRHGRVAIWDVATGDVCTWLEVEGKTRHSRPLLGVWTAVVTRGHSWSYISQHLGSHYKTLCMALRFWWGASWMREG